VTSVWATVRQWCLGLGCAALLVIASLPWVYSGERDRNSFALVRSADRLDLTDGLVHRAAQLGWLLMPAMVGVVVIAVALHRRTLAALGGLYVGGSSIAMALLVERSSLDRSHSSRPHPGISSSGSWQPVRAEGARTQPRRRPRSSRH
jgi:hypothetical protein